MNINDILKKKNMTKYLLSKMSGVPYATINDICNGKTSIEKCSAETLYRISKALKIDMEDLIARVIEDKDEQRIGFTAFRSNMCHHVKDMGDAQFVTEIIESDRIRRYYDRGWYPEAFYLLAMIDYLIRVNGLEPCTKYDDLRPFHLSEPLYPANALVISEVMGDNKILDECLKNAIPEFLKFNIVEGEIRNVA